MVCKSCTKCAKKSLLWGSIDLPPENYILFQMASAAFLSQNAHTSFSQYSDWYLSIKESSSLLGRGRAQYTCMNYCVIVYR